MRWISCPTSYSAISSMAIRIKVLAANSIWLCASCHTCSVRCPNSIDIAKVMDTLRSISNKSKAVPGDKNISLFHRIFLGLTKYTGRTYEPGMGIYVMQTGGLGGMYGMDDENVSERENQYYPDI